jgi:hypothetical protein
MLALFITALILGFGLFLILHGRGKPPAISADPDTSGYNCNTTYHACGVSEFHIDRYAQKPQKTDTLTADKDTK